MLRDSKKYEGRFIVCCLYCVILIGLEKLNLSAFVDLFIQKVHCSF